jgi:hypothetical protein
VEYEPLVQGRETATKAEQVLVLLNELGLNYCNPRRQATLYVERSQIVEISYGLKSSPVKTE